MDSLAQLSIRGDEDPEKKPLAEHEALELLEEFVKQARSCIISS